MGNFKDIFLFAYSPVRFVLRLQIIFNLPTLQGHLRSLAWIVPTEVTDLNSYAY